MTGAPTFIAMSMTLQIFCAWRSDSEPPNTVKSWAKTKTRRPLIVPEPVTTPSPGIFCVLHAEIDAIMLDDTCHILRTMPGSSSTLEPLARGQPALGVLRLDPLLAAAEPRLLAAPFELFDRGAHGPVLADLSGQRQRGADRG